MLARRPSIYIYVNNPSEKILREVCAGIEEEGIFLEVTEKESYDLELLTYEAAGASMLGSGIGICGDRVGFQVKGLARGIFISHHDNPTPAECRNLGKNSARAVKKLPFHGL